MEIRDLGPPRSPVKASILSRELQQLLFVQHSSKLLNLLRARGFSWRHRLRGLGITVFSGATKMGIGPSWDL